MRTLRYRALLFIAVYLCGAVAVGLAVGGMENFGWRGSILTCFSILFFALSWPLFIKELSFSPASPTYKQRWENFSQTREDAFFHVTGAKNEEDLRVQGWEGYGLVMSDGEKSDIGAERLIRELSIDKGHRVLEIGCGVARIGRELAPRCGEWHGVDISSRMIAFAKERTRHLPNVRLHELDGIRLPMFPDGSFDRVYSAIVFIHLDKEDTYEYLKEAYRVLKPGGLAYFDHWNLLTDYAYREWEETQHRNIGDRKTRDRNQFCTPAEFRMYVTRVGFRILRFFDTEIMMAICQK